MRHTVVLDGPVQDRATVAQTFSIACAVHQVASHKELSQQIGEPQCYQKTVKGGRGPAELSNSVKGDHVDHRG